MNVLLDVAVESWRDIVRFVRSLDLLDPDVKHAELLINETFKIVRFLKHIIDAAHEEGEETESDKLKEMIPIVYFLPLRSYRRCAHSELIQCDLRSPPSSESAG